ncbi:hypothetical protein Zm00014a_038693 [Zea mays]|uniref:Uncharacterized protein n=1 Tax=Zea mays TaxID=4577 RepID=A0A3L6FHP4_MAIZE|nr:hypothetical protein Zm00014a_038693 [Zea mays]
MMGISKRFEGVNWIIDGLSLTTITSFISSTVTSMLRRAGASRLLNTCSSTYTLHLPNMHMVAFHERQMLEQVVNHSVLIGHCSRHILKQIGYMRGLVASYIVTSLSGTLGRVVRAKLATEEA